MNFNHPESRLALAHKVARQDTQIELLLERVDKLEKDYSRLKITLSRRINCAIKAAEKKAVTPL